MMIKNKVLPLILLFVAITLLASCTAERGQEPGSGNGLTGLSLRITPDNPRVEEILRANEVGTETRSHTKVPVVHSRLPLLPMQRVPSPTQVSQV